MDLSDRIEIAELMARYCFCLDDGDCAGLGRLFTRDGLWQAAYGSATGPEAIAVYLAQLTAGAPKRRHFNTNLVLTAEGDAVRAKSYYLVARETGSGPGLSVAGTYRDRLRREDGAWRFAERVLTADILGDLGLSYPDRDR